MERLSRPHLLMQMAWTMAMRGTCSRLRVGVVFSRDGRIISTGYNGAPAGMPHCEHPKVNDSSPGVEQGCALAGHAEANGIAFASRHGLNLFGSTATITHMPCYNCALLLVNAGVSEVIYDKPYRLTAGVELLRQAGIPVIDFSTILGVV